MKVLAIYNGHNATVGLFEDGTCLEIIHEEKLNNVKNQGGFPIKAFEKVLSAHNAVDVIAFCQELFFQDSICYSELEPNEYLNRLPKTRKFLNWIVYKTNIKDVYYFFRKLILEFYSQKNKQRLISSLYKKIKEKNFKIVTSSHHLNHALTPIYFYGINHKCLIFTLDGAGDFECGSIWLYIPLNKFKKISSIRYDSSLGHIYGEVTRFLGMKHGEHEYKVMGLAAYVNEEKYYTPIYNKFKKIIRFQPEKLIFKTKFNIIDGFMFWAKENLVGYRFDSIAAAVQKLTEDLVMEWIRAAIRKTGIRTIAVSGGVFMNVKMNQKILFMPEVKKVYFQPSCGDESLVIGAAAKVFMDQGVELKPIKTMYLGLKYSNREVEEFLRKNGYFDKYRIEYYEDIEKKIAEMLAEFKIVARFKGTGEWGARSLCNRAILGNASDLRTFYEVNDMIKMRDFWMPFAPTILAEWAPKYIKNWDIVKEKAYESTKYMILTFDSTELAQKHLRAAIHQKDKTLRPQIVDREDNPDVYRLLKYYEELTGMGGFLNTSLNLHGYPLVGTLEQAMFTFENSGLKYIALENFLICKKNF